MVNSSGNFRDKISIKELDKDSQDDFGQPVESYIQVFDTRANVKVLTGNEVIRLGLKLGTEVISVLIRTDKRLSHEHYIEWLGFMYSISGIKPNDRMNRVVITASRQT